MSDKPAGLLETLGRFITGGSTSAQKKKSSNETTPSSSAPARSPNVNSSFLKEVMTLRTDSSPNKRAGNNLKYLSPSDLDTSVQKRNRTFNGLEIEVDPVSDIFSTPSLASQSRKRQLTETDRSLLSPPFRSESVKRVKDFGNRSLLEPTLRATIGSSRLDTTWSGQFSTCHSPASSVTNVSLLSMNTATTNGSSTFSSSTKHFLKKLEGANTPARDVQRMTMIRAGYTRPEKWATSSVSSGATSDAPPLRKTRENMQSRIQLLSKNMALPPNRKNYWRDLTRRRSDPKRNDDSNVSTVSKTTNGSAKSNELCSLFDVDIPSSNKKEEAPKKHQPVLKGSDGKALGKNTYRFSEDDDLSATVPENWLKNAEPLKLDAAPPKGFLGTLSFSFGAPVDVVSLVNTKKSVEPSVVSEPDESEKSDADDTNSGKSTDSSDSDAESNNTSDSDDSDDTEDQAGSESEKEAALKQKEGSRPQTSTDTISPAVSLSSSKDSSPKTNVVAPLQSSNAVVEEKKATPPAASATWSCDGCFTSWPEATNECGCCGTKKCGAAASGPPAQKTLVSNISTFAKSSKPSGVSFGFGTGGSTSSASVAPSAPAVSVGTSSNAPLFGITTSAVSTTAPAPVTLPTIPAPAPATLSTLPAPATILAPAPIVAVESATTSSSDRVAWDCPDCMVSNKATDDKCPCCGHVKYKSASGAPSSVFGDRAFKPTSTVSNGGFSFGTGNSSSSSTTTPSFGLSAKPAEASATSAVKSMFGTSVSTAAPVVPTVAAPILSAPAIASSVPTAVTAEPKIENLSSTTSTSKPSIFGSSSGSLFGNSNVSLAPISKPIEPKASLPMTFGLPAAPTVSTTTDASKPSASIFGNLGSTTSTVGSVKAKPFELSSSATSAPPPSVQEPSKPSIFGSGSSTNMFGAAPTTSEAPKTNMFGSSSSASIFGAPAAPPPTTSQNVPSIFGASSTGLFPTGSSSSSMFGASKDTPAPLFGSQSQGSDSTDGAPAAKKGSFFSVAADSTTKSFGAFGASSTSSSVAPSAPFGTSFGSGSTFGGFGAPPAVQPTISNSSSTSSLFSSTQAAPSEPQQNLFSSTAVPNSFNFGGSSMNGNSVFMFNGGSAAPPPPAPAPNNQPAAFGAFAAAPPAGENAFAYQAPSATAGRKMAMARRRNVRR